MIKIIPLFVTVLLLLQLVLGVDGDYDYSSDASYADDNFYKNSDPSQWDYNKVDYSKIPDDKYDELDYNQVDYSKITDHNKIDSPKYFQDKGCSSCSLDRGDQNLKFSREGINHPQGDFVTIPGAFGNTPVLLKGRSDRIEVLIADGTKLDAVPRQDSLTITIQPLKSEDGTEIPQEISLPDGTWISGKLSYRDGQAYVRKGDEAVINQVSLTSDYSNIGLFFNGQMPNTLSVFKDNFVSFSERKFIASGENINLKFGIGNPYFNPIPDITSKSPEEIIKSQRDSILAVYVIDQNDLLSFNLEGGALEVETRNDKNNLPLVTTQGNLEMQNNDNTIKINDQEVSYQADKKRYLEKSQSGSVYLELEAGGNEKDHYFFDDNHNIIQQDKTSYDNLLVDRMSIKSLYGVALEGYFSPKEISIFQNDLRLLSDNGFIEKITPPLKIWAIDRRAGPGEESKSFLNEAFVNKFILGNEIFWTPVYDLNEEYVRKMNGDYKIQVLSGKIAETSYLEPHYQRNLIHEVGHVVNNQYSMTNNFLKNWAPKNSPSEGSIDTFEGEWKTTLTKNGVTLILPKDANPLFDFKFEMEGDSGKLINSVFSDTKQQDFSDDDGSSYATTNIAESQAELFAMIFTDSDWFENEERIKGPLPEGKTAGDIISIRNQLRDLYLNVK